MKYALLIFVALSLSFFFGCKKDKISYTPTPYTLEIPSHFPQMIIPGDNPMTKEGVALGRMLFYETQLSRDNSISCASCHAPQNAFSDSNQFSEGVNGTLGNRQSMALINLGWNSFFFWDGRAKTLEEQILEPVENPVEMHETWPNVVKKLDQSVEYRTMFMQAFSSPGIDKYRSAKAIAQFLRTMISGNSKYDVMYKFENGFNLTSEEQAIYTSVTPNEWAGYDLFQSVNGADCLHCHNGTLMQIQKFSNNGLDSEFADLGRGDVTGNPSEYGKFKVPTIRNIAYTAPYMHDGRFSTLDEVINHYSNGIVQSPTLDPLIEFSFQGGVQLDAFEKQLLKEFLLTLSDESFMNNTDFKQP